MDMTINSLYRYLAFGVQKRLFQLSIRRPWCWDSLSDIEGFSQRNVIAPHNLSRTVTPWTNSVNENVWIELLQLIRCTLTFSREVLLGIP